MKNIIHSLLLLSASSAPILMPTISHAEVWDSFNDPALFDSGKKYDYQLKDLPTQAQLQTVPWSETYWPSYKGSINVRWNTPDKDGFKYTPPTREVVTKMTIDQLLTLSPSEKYDLFLGHYDYPFWNEVKQYADPTATEYTGLCDGWSIAAIQYGEPKAVTLPNPDGILIPFGSSDVKALMTFDAEFYFRRRTIQVGRACQTNSPTTPDQMAACSGMNPGAMQVILGNQIGLLQQGFVTERQPDAEQWNQPVYSYTYQVMGSAVTTVPGAHGVLVHAVLRYSEDLDESYVQPVVGTSNFHSNAVKMDYILDLDAQENIIGGTWMPGSDRVGYFWMPTNHLDFTNSLSALPQIYQPVNQAATTIK